MGRTGYSNSPRYAIVTVEAACAATGLTLEELLRLRSVEQLTQRFEDGRSETALRLPVELLAVDRTPAE